MAEAPARRGAPEEAPAGAGAGTMALVLVFLSVIPALGLVAAGALWLRWSRERSPALLVCAGLGTLLAVAGLALVILNPEALSSLGG